MSAVDYAIREDECNVAIQRNDIEQQHAQFCRRCQHTARKQRADKEDESAAARTGWSWNV